MFQVVINDILAPLRGTAHTSHTENGPLRGRSVAHRWLSTGTRSLVQYVLAKGPAMISLSTLKRGGDAQNQYGPRGLGFARSNTRGEERCGWGIAWDEGFRSQAVTAGSHHMFLGGRGGTVTPITMSGICRPLRRMAGDTLEIRTKIMADRRGR